MGFLSDFYKKAKKKLQDWEEPVQKAVSSGLGYAYNSAKNYLGNATQKADDYVAPKLQSFDDNYVKPEEDFTQKYPSPMDYASKEIAPKIQSKAIQPIKNFAKKTYDASGDVFDDPMKVSKPLERTSYFKPTENVRARDFVREIPGAALKTGKEMIGGTLNVASKAPKIFGEGLAYATDPNVREQYEKGNTGILPTISNTSPASMLADTGKAVLEVATAGKTPKALNWMENASKLKRLAAGAGTGYGFDVLGNIADKGKATPKDFVPGMGTAMGAGFGVVGKPVAEGITKEASNISKDISNFRNPYSKRVTTKSEYEVIPGVFSGGDPATRPIPGSERKVIETVRNPFVPESVTGKVLTARPGLNIEDVNMRKPKVVSSEDVIAKKQAKAKELVGRQIDNQKAGLDTAEPGFVAPQNVQAPAPKPSGDIGEDIANLSRSEFSPYKRQVITVGKANPRSAKIIQEKTGIDVSQFNHEVDNYALRHSLKKHSKDEIPLTVDDFKFIPDIIENPSTVAFAAKTKQGLNALKYSKKYNGTVYYIEEVRTGNNTLSMTTMYKTKTPSSGANLAADESALGSRRPLPGEATTPQLDVSLSDTSTKSGISQGKQSRLPDIEEYVNGGNAEKKPLPSIEEFVNGKQETSKKLSLPDIEEFVRSKGKIADNGTPFDVPEGGYNEYQKRAYEKRNERINDIKKLLDYPNELRKIGYKKSEIRKIGNEQADRILKLSELGFPKNAMPKDLLSDQVDRIIKKKVSWGQLKDYYARKKSLNTNFLDGVDPSTLSDINPLMAGGRDVYRNFEAAFGKNYPKIKEQLLDPFDEAKGNLFKEQEALTNEVFDQVVKKLGIKKGSDLDKAVVEFGEGKKSLADLQKDFPDDWEKVVKADAWFRNKYPELLDDLNAVREANFPTHPLYPESSKVIPQRADYYRHGRNSEGFTGLRNMFEGSASIDPALAVSSDVTNPKTKWLSFAQKRKGDANDFGAIEGYLDYIKNHSYAKHIDPFIQRFKGIDDEAKDMLPQGAFSGDDTRRGLAEELSQKMDPVQQISDSSDPARIKSILIDKEVSEPQAEWMSKELANIPDYEKTQAYLKNKLKKNTGKQLENLGTASSPAEKAENKENNFLVFIKNFSRDLAGKTNPLDRPFQENVFGRKALSIANWANSRFKANAILGNASSSLAQFFNIPQGIANAGIKNSAKAVGSSLAGIFKEGGPIKQSAFIRERTFDGFNKFDTGILNDTKKFAVWMTGIGDEVGTKFIWNSQYQKALSDGIANPVKYADDWTRKMVAGRGIGEVPILQKSKIVQLVAPFQLEVANQWYALRDIAKNDPRKLVVAKKMLEFSVASYLMNRVVKEIRGSDVSFDPINSMIEAYDEYKNEDNKAVGAAKALGRIAGEGLSNIPGGQTFAGVYPEYGFGIDKETFPNAAKVLNIPRKDFFGEGDPTRFGTGLPLISAIQNPLTGFALPFGGKQIDKMYQGGKALLKGYAENNTGKVMTPVDSTPGNIARGLLFGKSALGEVQDYYDKNSAPLSDMQTEKYKLMGNDLGYFNKVSAERASDKEKESLKTGKASGETKNLSDDMSQLSNGNIYVKSLDKEFKTEKLARFAVDKQNFIDSEDRAREYNGDFWYKDSNGDFHKESMTARKSKLDKSSSNLEMDRAQAKKDVKAWATAADKKITAINTYISTLDPAIDQDQIDQLTLEKENLIDKALKIESQGGFTKGRAPKKLEEKFRYPSLVDPEMLKISSLIAGTARKPVIGKRALPLIARRLPPVRRTRRNKIINAK